MTSRVGDKSEEHRKTSVSELLPWLTFVETSEWSRKASLVRISFVLASVILMEFALGQKPPWFEVYGLIVASYLALESAHIIYNLCGIRKPWWWLALLAAPVFIVCREVAVHPGALCGYSTFVDNLLPAGVQVRGSFFDRWAFNFFTAALPEELFKICPVLIAFAIGRLISSPWRERLGVWEPLDGILLGSSCAMGFSVAETVYTVVMHGTSIGTLVLSSDNAALWAFPRGLSEVAGHAAYTGFLGYTIGLVVIRPRRWWFTLPFGLLIATLAHSLWDATSSYYNGTAYIIALIEAIVFYVLLAAAILQARRISPTRQWNFATDFIGSRGARSGPGAAVPTPAAASRQSVSAVAVAPAVGESAEKPPESAAEFNLYVAGKIVPLALGRKIRASEIVGLTANDDSGVVAEIVSSPKHPDAIGLKNLSTTFWRARFPGNFEETVQTGQSIAISRGIVFIFWETRGEVL
jgi:RsiW-degrading membrane proteinase PrsW (M82 family)